MTIGKTHPTVPAKLRLAKKIKNIILEMRQIKIPSNTSPLLLKKMSDVFQIPAMKKSKSSIMPHKLWAISYGP